MIDNEFFGSLIAFGIVAIISGFVVYFKLVYKADSKTKSQGSKEE